ncbi:MAG: hypothetical protein AAFV80_13485 [Bacteroidota bacterium]
MRNLILLMALGVLSSCKLADVRPSAFKNDTIAPQRDGREMLAEAVNAMGYQNLENLETYSAKSVFKWKTFWSIMPMNSLRGNKGNEIEFHFVPNSFDSKVQYHEGRKRGDIHGLQSWEAYRELAGKALKFKKDKRRTWGQGAYHYMIEAPYRLLEKAPIVKYAGEREWQGQTYDLIFATWYTEEPNKEHDQWLLYVNRETKFIDLAHITIREFFLPFPKNMAHGTVVYPSRTEKNGIYFPDEVIIQLGKPKKNTKKKVYRFSLYDYQFNSIEKQTFYPNPDLKPIGDHRPVER